MFKRFEHNTTGRDFFVGDIHGCFDKLDAAMAERDFDESKDRIFSVGDLVDRGSRSHEAIDYLARPYFHAVRGNHEDLAIRLPNGFINTDNYRVNGGKWNLELSPERQKINADIFAEMPLCIEVETSLGLVGVVHAEAYANDWTATKENLNKKHAREFMLWGRSKITLGDALPVSGVDILVVGHTPLKHPHRLGNVWYIDTGACYGHDLTFKTIEELDEILLSM